MTTNAGTGPVLDPDAVRFVLCDLDGVVWLAHQALPGAAEAVAAIRASGRRVLFVTNNSMMALAEQEEALAAIGIPSDGDLATSAQAAAMLVEPDARVLVCGGPGVFEALEQRGAEPIRSAEWRPGCDVGAVIVGLHRDFSYDGLQAANAAIRAGARFIATNLDATFPTPDGPTPGAGSIVAAVRTVAETDPVVAGKPYPAMAQLVAHRCGSSFSPTRAVMVGDRASTDGSFAAAIGCPFVLVRTGVAPPGAAPDAEVPVAADLAALSDLAVVLADSGGAH